MSEALPKQVLLVKLLKMTASPNDGEALTAMRKANELLTSAGWDWDRVMAGKIVVVEDPFAAIGTPPSSKPREAHDWNPAPAAAPPPQPAPPKAKHTTWPLGTVANKFAAFCYCCGQEVHTGKGFIFKPYEYSAGPNSWRVACTPCNMTAIVQNYDAPHVKQRRKANVTDLA